MVALGTQFAAFLICQFLYRLFISRFVQLIQRHLYSLGCDPFLRQRSTNLESSPALKPQFVIGKGLRIALFIQKTLCLETLQDLCCFVRVFLSPIAQFVCQLSATTLCLGTVSRSAGEEVIATSTAFDKTGFTAHILQHLYVAELSFTEKCSHLFTKAFVDLEEQPSVGTQHLLRHISYALVEEEWVSVRNE